jgi:hypothetical protein
LYVIKKFLYGGIKMANDRSHFATAFNLNEIKRGRNPEQKRVIDYFLKTGLLAFFGIGIMADEEYENLVVNRMNSLNLKSRALSKIGIDEDELQEIPPVFLHGYHFEDAMAKQTWAKIGKDDRVRSSKYDCAWLFFSSDQVYMYAYTFDMASDVKREKTEEYFYTDITNLSTGVETTETRQDIGCMSEPKITTREYTEFGLVVPGDKFKCSMSGVPDAEQAIAGMKHKLRDKKQKRQ